MTPCPLALDERHDWQVDPETSDLACMRYVCACGRRAWRQRALPGRPRVGAPIREYASSAGRPAKRPELKPDTTTAKPHPGSNATGHKLPASSTSRRD